MPGKAKILTHQEIDAVFNVLDSPRDKVIFGLGIYTGLRISEILQLKQDHVFTSNGGIRQLLICKRLKKRGTVYSDIPVHPKLCQLLVGYRRQVADNQWLFPSDESIAGCLSRARAQQIFYDAFKKLNIVGASTHSMRRSCLTYLSRAGVPLRTIQTISGHSNLGQLQAYLEVDPEERHRAINLLAY